MDDPRWLVDEMLGRLTRYLRFLGYDAAYARGLSDDQVVERAKTEARRLITRDRRLSERVPESILLTRTDIAGQVSELAAAVPGLRRDVRFDRCSICNGRLTVIDPATIDAKERDHLPGDVRAGRVPFYRCSECGHFYWEGSHTASVRSRLARWFPTESEGQ